MLIQCDESVYRTSVKYVYNKKGQKCGCVVGIAHPDYSKPLIGVSRCKLNDDTFSKKRAVELAVNRAKAWAGDDLDSKLNKHFSKCKNLELQIKFCNAIDFVSKMLSGKITEYKDFPVG